MAEIRDINISYAAPPQKVFKDIDHYKRVRLSIIQALAKKKSKTDSLNSSFLIERLVVDVSTKYKKEELWIDYENSRVVLEVPRLARDTKETIVAKKMSYYGHLLKSVEALVTIGVSHIYLVLNEDGRAQLENGKRRSQVKSPPKRSPKNIKTKKRRR